MFYAHFVLAKKGPLSRIWLAAHWDKKLTKAHVFETNIEQSVDGILQPKVKMALRTSGHLLLGVVRIYSRKAKYLLADCNEAFVKIKMAFRPGMVDLPEDNREAAMNAITLPEVFHDFDTEMPDLNDVDIQAQFSMNQTRAEEITMREDYGNINLDTGDDGFGDVPSMDPPEMLREADHHFGGADTISFGHEVEENRDFSEHHSIAGESMVVEGSVHGKALGIDIDTHSLAPSARTQIDQPIQDDGFGGSIGGGQMLAGGLFEDESLIDETVHQTSVPGSERIPPSEAPTFADEPFQGPPSPRAPSSNGDSRPPTPMDADSPPPPPGSPTPSHHSVASKVSSYAPSQAPSTRSVATTVPPPPATPQPETTTEAQDETTLLHNEEESFALAPVEASAIKGFTRTKRKRKLIVDEIKAISGEEMKGQLGDTSDIVTTLDLAPPTKRLMHWKETGGVEKLFALSCRILHNPSLLKSYQKNLTAKPAEDEMFENLAGSYEATMPLGNVRGGFQEPGAPPQTPTRGRKRKAVTEDDDSDSEYPKRQDSHLSKQEERDRRAAARNLQAEEDRGDDSALNTSGPDPDPPSDDHLADEDGMMSPGPGVADTSDPSIEIPRGAEPSSEMLQTPANLTDSVRAPPDRRESTSTNGGPVYPPGTPVYNTAETPAHHSGHLDDDEEADRVRLEPEDSVDASGDLQRLERTGDGLQSPHSGRQRSSYQDDDDGRQSLPGPPDIPPQTDFTDRWVSEAADATATGAAIPPDQTPLHQGYEVPPPEPCYDDDQDQGGYDDDYVDNGEEDEMQEDETIENFEDRVLNKRAAQLHRNLGKKFAESSMITFTQLASRKNDRKQVAQKFYSLLVLQKVQACDVQQDSIYGDLRVVKGPKFDTAANSL